MNVEGTPHDFEGDRVGRDAVADITSGATLAVGGFGLCGIPDALIAALAEARRDRPRGVLQQLRSRRLRAGNSAVRGRIRRVTASYVGENKEFARQYLAGELEVELTPQGTLAERLRAGGAGIPAFFTPAGVGSPVSDGGLPWRYAADGSVAVASPPKETRVFGGQDLRARRVDHRRLRPGARRVGRHRAAISSSTRPP